jgi:hypothetical protein
LLSSSMATAFNNEGDVASDNNKKQTDVETWNDDQLWNCSLTQPSRTKFQFVQQNRNIWLVLLTVGAA